MSKEFTHRMAEAGLEAWREGKTSGEGTPRILQPNREGAQVLVRRNHFDEECQDEKEDWQYLSEVEWLHDDMKEAKGCAIASTVKKEVSWAISQAKMVQQGGKQELERKFCNTTEWSIESSFRTTIVEIHTCCRQ